MSTDTPTQIGMVGMAGLGRMGANVVRRLIRDGHSCVIHDIDSADVGSWASHGAAAATSLTDPVGQVDIAHSAPSAMRKGFGGTTRRRDVSLKRTGSMMPGAAIARLW